MLPVARRHSDDRCSLLTNWTNSTASLKSCVSHHNTESRLIAADCVSTAAESDGGAYRRRTGTGRRQPPKHRDRSDAHRLDTRSKSKRLVDGSISSRPSRNYSRKCESSVKEPHDRPSKYRPAGQSSSTWRNANRSSSRWSTRSAHRRRATAHVDLGGGRAPLSVNIDDDDFITTSSASDEDPSTSTSSFTPANCVNDRASLLSCSTTSSSVPPTRRSRHPAEPPLKGSSRHFLQSPRRRKSRLQRISNDIDDEDVNRSKSSEEIAVASRYFSEETTGESRENELRAARSLFEFHSNDELRIANNFIDGVWSLCSRRSLYNQRYMCSKPPPFTSTPPTSLVQFYYSRSDKDFLSDVGSDPGQVVSNDNWKSNLNEVTGSEQVSVRTTPNNQDVVDADNGKSRLNVADIAVHRDSICAQKEFRPLEIIEELTKVTANTSNEGDLKIYIRKSPKTSNNATNATVDLDTEVPDTENRASLPKLVTTACDKHPENSAVLCALSHRQTETDAVNEKLPGLTTLLAELLTNGSGAKSLPAATGSGSRFAGEIVQVFDALLVRSGVRETAPVGTDVKTLHSLSAEVNDCTANKRPDESNFLQADSVATTAGNDFGSVPCTAISDKWADFNKSRCGQETERKSDIVWRLTPRLLIKPHLCCDLASTKPKDSMLCNTEDANTELSSPKEPSYYDNGCTTSTNSIQTNTEDPQSTGETRQRIPRRARGRGKVRELIKLFESVSASTLDNNASPIDVKRATISAAVSVGEMLRRASEQEVTSCDQNACALLDVSAKQTTTSSKSTEALSSGDISQAPNIAGGECLPKLEEIVLHKSTAKWPTMSRVRRKRNHRPVCTTAVDESASPRVNVDRLSEISNSISDTRTAPPDDDGKKLSLADDNVSKMSKAVPLLGKEDVKLMKDDGPEHQDASTIHSANSLLRTERPETDRCKVADAASTSKISSPAVSGIPTVVESGNVSSQPARQEHFYHLPSSSSSSSSQWQSKTLHTCEVAATANTFIPSAGGSGDVGGRHDKGRPAFSDVKCEPFNEKIHPATNYTAHDGPMLPSTPRQQPLSTASPVSVTATIQESKEILSSSELATNDDCQRFNAQSWFIAGGPHLAEVSRWSLTSAKDLTAINHRNKWSRRRPAKATLKTETSCPAAYPVLRMTHVTVHLLNNVDSMHVGAGNGTGGAEYAVDSSSRGEKRQSTRLTTKQSCSHEIQAAKHKRSRTVNKLTKGEEQLREKPASRNETVFSAAKTKTTGLDHKFDVTPSPDADFRGRDDVKTPRSRKNRDRLERDCKSVSSILSSSRRTTSDVASDTRPTDDPTSKRLSPSDKHADIGLPTSIMANCGLVSGEPIQSPCGVTVVCSRRRSTLERPSSVTFRTPSQLGDQTQLSATDSCTTLAQQFLLTSLVEYRLDARRK